MPHRKLESSLCLHFARVTGSQGFPRQLSDGVFSARRRQAAYLYRFSLSFPFSNGLPTSQAAGELESVAFSDCVHKFSIFKCADCNSLSWMAAEDIHRVTLLLLSVQIASPRK